MEFVKFLGKLGRLRRFAIGATVITFVLAGCALPNRQGMLDKWAGKNIQQATIELGPPHRTIQMPQGQTMYIWEQQYGVRSETLCRTGLQVDSNGIIVDASQETKSLLCK
ncbi:MAG: hypothetical protein CML18_14805 [Pusillimonas sp.]|jgi:hypothetical protein|nr:hypothetical protein [Pusillimonas sp.]